MIEEQVTFKAHSDKMCYGVSGDNEEMLVEISGYDLNTRFNLDKINSLEDAENACAALSNVFFQGFMRAIAYREPEEQKQ